MVKDAITMNCPVISKPLKSLHHLNWRQDSGLEVGSAALIE